MSQPLYSEPGPPVVVEFTDYQCPFCRAASPMVDSAVSDGVRLAVLQFPLSIHPRARVAALAALCGARSGRFAKIHRYLMNHIEWMASDDSSIVPAIEPIDSAAFVACQGSEQTRKSLAQEIAVANTLGIAGTPMLVTAGGVLKQPVTAASLRALADDGSK
ncbi:MAG TPA: thioredoxin domain-containing protein [Gemmatimonadaceae bacterium]|nr:thioredoxin domain-containing protein [Gemmatimonadaceae bacterium]